jgi:hypothetical protein
MYIVTKNIGARQESNTNNMINFDYYLLMLKPSL